MEQFVNNAQTTLPAALSATWPTISFSSIPGPFPMSPQFRILISDAINGDELVLVIAVASSGGGLNWTIARGIEGTPAVAHPAGCTLTATLTASALGTLRVGAMFDVSDYGATGDGTTDDTAAINNACADAAVAGGTVFVPNGTYIVSRQANNLCVVVYSNTTLLGESREGAIIRLNSGQLASTRPIVLGDGTGVTDVAIRNLTIDGNKANNPDNDEHGSAIFMYQYSSRLYFADLIIHDNTGDAFDLYEGAQFVTIERCYCHDNLWMGVNLNEGYQQHIWIRDCQFVNNGNAIHIEYNSAPFVGLVATDIAITDCLFDVNNAGGNSVLSFAGISTAPVTNIRVSDCVINGVVYTTYASGIVIENCVITTSSSDITAPVLIETGSQGVVVRNNIITIVPQTGPNAHGVIAVADGSDATIIGNTCVSTWSVAHGVYLLNASAARIIDNAFYSYDGTNTGSGVLVYTNGPILDHCVIANNYFCDPQYAVYLWPDAYVGDLLIQGNIIEKVANTNLTGAFWLTNCNPSIGLQVSAFDNELLGLSEAFVKYPATPLLTAGLRGAGGTYTCTGTPEGQIAEIVGAIAVRSDGGTGTTLYVKESGSGNSGWVAK